MNKKNIWEEAKQIQEEKKEKENIANKYDINKDNIIIDKKVSKFKVFINNIGFIIFKILKICLYIIVFILVTVGSTVLINSNLRNELLTIFTQNV